MNTTEELPRKFKGIWIPREIWLHPKLTPLQKCVVAEIDSLSFPDEPCCASDSYLANMFQVTIGRMKNILTELRALKVIESCGFDSQNRRLLRLKIGVTESVTRVTESVTPKVTESVTPLIRENKEKRKEESSLSHDARAKWIQAYEKETGRIYGKGSKKRIEKDAEAIQSMLDDGRTPDEIGQTAARMFKTVKAANGEANKILFYSSSVRTIDRFADLINNIEGELENYKIRNQQQNQQQNTFRTITL